MAQNLIRAAFPVERHGNAKGAVASAGRKLSNISERRARSIWNGEARKIEYFEMIELQEAALEQAHRDKANAEHRIEMLKKASRKDAMLSEPRAKD